MRHQRDSGYRVDTQQGERRPHTQRLRCACQKKGYTLTAVSGEYDAEEGFYTACDDVADQNSADVIMTDTEGVVIKGLIWEPSWEMYVLG
jgi:hypothetical protein